MVFIAVFIIILHVVFNPYLKQAGGLEPLWRRFFCRIPFGMHKFGIRDVKGVLKEIAHPSDQIQRRFSTLSKLTMEGNAFEISVKVPVPSIPSFCPSHPGPNKALTKKKNAIKLTKTKVNILIPSSCVGSRKQ